MKNHRKPGRTRPIIENIDLDENEAQDRSVKMAMAISHVLKKRELSIDEFAVIMGKDPAIIQNWLTGKHTFNLHTLFEISDKLNLF